MGVMYEKFLNFLGFETEYEDMDESGSQGTFGSPRKLDMRFINPKTFDDVTLITDALNGGHCAIVNLGTLSREDAKRITDFAYGSVYAVKGNVNKLSDGLFLFTPRNVNLVNPNQAVISKPGIASVKSVKSVKSSTTVVAEPVRMAS